jgi:RNA polymerase sigma-70 factor (ECF subfamily)
LDGGDEQELARLMHAAVDGDDRSYAEFLRRTAILVRRFAQRRIVQGDVEPEDIVQETLLAIHAKRHTWRRDAAVTPWIYAIARYKLVDAFRRQGRKAEIDVTELAETLAAPEAETLRDRDLRRALDTLAPGQRSVVSAVSLEGQSIGNAAKKLGMSEVAVRVAFHRALTALAMRFRRD